MSNEIKNRAVTNDQLSDASSKELEQFGYKQELKRALPLPFLVIYGWAFVCLLTGFGTYGAVAEASHGMPAGAFLFASIGMLFTGLSYVFMSKAFPISGSVYQYVSNSFSNRHLGFLSGWSILLDYMLVPMINELLACIYLQIFFPEIPTWVILTVSIAIVTIVNHLGIEVAAWFNNIIVIIEIIFIVAIIFVMFRYVANGGGAGTVMSIKPFFNPDELGLQGVGVGVIFAGTAITIASYSGFDAVTTMAEEAKDSHSIGKAVMIVVISISVFYMIATYIMTLVWPDGWREFTTPDDAPYEVFVIAGGPIAGSIFSAMYIVATFASAIAAQASASRVIYNMGRDGILPKKVFGYVHPKRKTPTAGILLIGAVSFTILLIPLTTSFLLLSYGALIGFAMVNLSVILYYWIKKKERGASAVIKYLIVPVLGAAVCITSFISISAVGKIVGTAWLLLGFIILAISTRGFKDKPAELNL